MSDSCCSPPAPSADPRYRRILGIALVLNITMFGVEIAGSVQSGSVSLLADAIDFLGDAANYGISLAVLGLAIGWRARASIVKAICMAGFGTFVLGRAIWSFLQGGVPEPLTMGAVAVLALCVNVGVALMLYRYRTGDSNMRSVWRAGPAKLNSPMRVDTAPEGEDIACENWSKHEQKTPSHALSGVQGQGSAGGRSRRQDASRTGAAA